MKNIKNIAKELVNLNIKEINELSKVLENKYGIKYNINNINNNLINNNDDKTNNKQNENIKKQSSFVDIYLKSVGTVKLPVIKLINSITGLSLTESKKLIDNIPSLIKKLVKIKDAKEIQENFKKIEAIVELKESKNNK
ncbi:MAG: ribosomal protein L7/L12 [Candidatus Shikimatogenerans bostrichidophilus]|nr:MAG: ribosomal protein L7/L12 [Candidatus Shikimatogenerans bostrichidophilus]